MTYRELLSQYYSLAKTMKKEDSAIKELVLALSNKSNTDFYLSIDEQAENEDEIIYRIKEYLYQNKPIQYILGYSYFYGLKLKVNSNVLIPRFDTEILVEEVLKRVNNENNLKIIDVCTGSGCIALALKNNLNNASIIGTDISKEALSVARENADTLNLDVDFIESDLLDNVEEGEFDILVSNPPYIPYDEEVGIDVYLYEPHLALYSKDNGMYHYDRILKSAIDIMKPKNIMAFEIAYNKEDEMRKLINKYYINSNIEVIKDLSGNNRVMLITNKGCE